VFGGQSHWLAGGVGGRMPSWSSPAARSPQQPRKGGTRRPDPGGAWPAAADRSRGPPPHGGPGVDSAGPA